MKVEEVNDFLPHMAHAERKSIPSIVKIACVETLYTCDLRALEEFYDEQEDRRK